MEQWQQYNWPMAWRHSETVLRSYTTLASIAHIYDYQKASQINKEWLKVIIRTKKTFRKHCNGSHWHDRGFTGTQYRILGQSVFHELLYVTYWNDARQTQAEELSEWIHLLLHLTNTIYYLQINSQQLYSNQNHINWSLMLAEYFIIMYSLNTRKILNCQLKHLWHSNLNP